MVDVIEDVPRLELQQLRILPNWNELRMAGGAKVEMALPGGERTFVEVTLDREPPAWPRRRWWLICDCCGSRRRHLYFLHGQLKCRRCHRLLFAQQAMSNCSWRENVGLPVLRQWRACLSGYDKVEAAVESY